MTFEGSRDLQHALTHAFKAAPRKQIGVACWLDGATQFAAIDSGPDRGVAPPDRMFPAGCLTKLFTAALVEDAAMDAVLDVDAPIGGWLPTLRRSPSLSALTVRQLLEHRHGRDDSSLIGPALRANGTIDTEWLGLALSTALAPAGTVYSYGNAGAWLAAAVLERVRNELFAKQLRDTLFAPLGMRPLVGATTCPSVGAGLVVSLADMLRFLRRQLARPAWENPSGIAPLPGWNPLELGIYRGWKYYGRGWFGHQSTWPCASSVVRIHPHRRTALVVASRDHAASLVALRLFGSRLPGFQARRAPTPLREPRQKPIELAAYPGCYRSLAESISIETDGSRSIRLCRGVRCYALRAAQGDLFYTRPGELADYPFIQLVGRSRGRFRYLWNGRRVLVRSGH